MQAQLRHHSSSVNVKPEMASANPVPLCQATGSFCRVAGHVTEPSRKAAVALQGCEKVANLCRPSHRLFPAYLTGLSCVSTRSSGKKLSSVSENLDSLQLASATNKHLACH